LPHGSAVRFLDENLQPLEIDLYDLDVWKRYGWSPITSQQFRHRYAEMNGDTDGALPESGKLASLDLYLMATLKRAQRFHEAMDAVAGSQPPVALLAIGGDCEETLNSPVIIRDRKNDRWVTLIRPREFTSASGVRFKEHQVTEAMYAPGDGRVTRASLLGENLQRLQHGSESVGYNLPLTYAVFGCDLHGQLPRNKSLQDNALTAIVGEAMK